MELSGELQVDVATAEDRGGLMGVPATHLNPVGVGDKSPRRAGDHCGGEVEVLDPRKVKQYYVDEERYDWVVDPKYPEKLFHLWREHAIARRLRRLGRQGTVLDLGAGTGLIARHLVAQRVVCLDINTWALQRAVTHVGSSVQYVSGDAEALPLASNSFDLVVCTDVLEHLLGVDAALNEIRRVLRPGGLLAGEVPSRHFIWTHRSQLTTTCPISEPFHNNYSPGEVRALLGRHLSVLAIRKVTMGLEVFFVARKSPQGGT